MENPANKIKTAQQKIRELQGEISRLEDEIGRCKHDFAPPIYDPETVKEPSGYKFCAQGSDTWSEPTGYTDVKKDRWSRTCKICGKVEYTYKREPVIKEYRPKFD